MSDTIDQPKNYEDIFIALIEYIRDNPQCTREACLKDIHEKFNLTKGEDSYFVNMTIEKIALKYPEVVPPGGATYLSILPDALFYLMEYRELKHSLAESKQARKQATMSTWFAVAGIAISIIGLFISIHYSKLQIELTKQQMQIENSKETKKIIK
jgi:hypothetical protein